MLYLSNHLWTIVNSVLLVAKGRKVGRQHDLLFLFLLVLGGSGGGSGAAPRVAPRSGPGGGCGCTVRVPTRSRPLKKILLSLLQYCVSGMFIYRIPDPHFSISDPGSMVQNRGVTKIWRLSLLTNSALVYEPKCGGGESCGVPANEYSCAPRSPNNFGDLTLYKTYGPSQRDSGSRSASKNLNIFNPKNCF
jgi:hypothetical protein